MQILPFISHNWQYIHTNARVFPNLILAKCQVHGNQWGIRRWPADYVNNAESTIHNSIRMVWRDSIQYIYNDAIRNRNPLIIINPFLFPIHRHITWPTSRWNLLRYNIDIKKKLRNSTLYNSILISFNLCFGKKKTKTKSANCKLESITNATEGNRCVKNSHPFYPFYIFQVHMFMYLLVYYVQ